MPSRVESFPRWKTTICYVNSVWVSFKTASCLNNGCLRVYIFIEFPDTLTKKAIFQILIFYPPTVKISRFMKISKWSLKVGQTPRYVSPRFKLYGNGWKISSEIINEGRILKSMKFSGWSANVVAWTGDVTQQVPWQQAGSILGENSRQRILAPIYGVVKGCIRVSTLPGSTLPYKGASFWNDSRPFQESVRIHSSTRESFYTHVKLNSQTKMSIARVRC